MNNKDKLKQVYEETKAQLQEAAEKAEAEWHKTHIAKVEAYEAYKADKNESTTAAYEAAKVEADKAQRNLEETKGKIMEAFNAWVTAEE